MILNLLKAAFLGNNPVDAIYYGDNLIYPQTGNYLTFEGDGSIRIGVYWDAGASSPKMPSMQYSYDKTNWYTLGNTYIPINGRIYVRGKNDFINQGLDRWAAFQHNGSTLACYGNVMMLLNYETPDIVIRRSYCFYRLFWGCPNLINAPELPATTLSVSCYREMFRGCTKLKVAPELPATKVVSSCYNGMFYGCTSLVEAPELPATGNCGYGSMFYGCTSLVEAPELLATGVCNYGSMFYGCTSLVNGPSILPGTGSCNYENMFYGCTSMVNGPSTILCEEIESFEYMFYNCSSLVKGPEIMATSTGGYACRFMFTGCTSMITGPSKLCIDEAYDYCFDGMFKGCTSLVTAPEIISSYLGDYCCRNMFESCTSLVNVPKLQVTTVRPFCYYRMFYGCTSLVTAPEISVPENWTASEQTGGYAFESMFENCTSLVNPTDLSEFTYFNVSACRRMFKGCNSLKTLAKVSVSAKGGLNCFDEMYANCLGLEHVELPVFSLTAGGEFMYAFKDCINIKSVHVPDFATIDGFTHSTGSDSKHYAYAFEGCHNLNSIKIGFVENEYLPIIENMFSNGLAEYGTYVVPSLPEWYENENPFPSTWTMVIDPTQFDQTE